MGYITSIEKFVREEGIQKSKRQIAKRMLALGHEREVINELLDLSDRDLLKLDV